MAKPRPQGGQNRVGTATMGRLHAAVAAVALGVTLVGCDSSSADPTSGVLTDEACRRCHGSEQSAAPPNGCDGQTDTSDRAVGAHEAHLRDGSLRARIACNECHLVPTDHNDTSHADEAPAEVDFGSLAATASAEPSWDGAADTCSEVYCHGATLHGGGNTAPSWTEVGTGQSDCGSCHGLPPPLPHPPGTECVVCHFETLDAEGNIDLAAGKHIDGVVQAIGENVVMTCSTCHGSDDNPAPPQSVAGYTDTAAVEVGAHQSHLRDGLIRMAIPCHECHEVPTDPEDPTHIDTPPAEVLFGTLATTADVDAAWDHASEACAEVYCHGATLSGGSNTAPVWTVVDGTEAACGSCHGNPPPLPHPPSGDCHKCHNKTVDEDGNIDIEGGKHIDGILQHAVMTCFSCHGSDESIAPPVSTTDETSTQYVGVGAHQAHLVDGPLAKAMFCNACHVIPNGIYAPGHIDEAPAELTWGTLATTDGAAPSWDHDQETCSDTYCHGATLGGGLDKTPQWTKVGLGEAACGMCHGLPPPPPHMAFNACYLCHSETVNSSWQINIETHVDGILQVSFGGNCDGCHGAPPATGAHLVHFSGAVGDASYGGTGITGDYPSSNGYIFDCGNCHPIDPSHHGNGPPGDSGGVAEVDLSPAGAPPGSLKSMHLPTASYIPGVTVLQDASGMAYTEGTCSDVYCHSDKTVSSGPVPAPGGGFPFTGYPLTYYPAYTVNIGRAYQTIGWGDSLSCDGCHGFPPRTSYPEVQAGVGDSHSWIDDWGYDNLHAYNMAGTPVPCAGCHFTTVADQGTRGFDSNWFAYYDPIPIVGWARHVNGAPDVGFTDELVLVRNQPGFDLTVASYDPANKSCSNVPCHLQQTEVVWGAPYRWWNSYECNMCHQY